MSQPRSKSFIGSYKEESTDEESSDSEPEIRVCCSDSEPLSDFVPERRYSTDGDYECSDQQDIETEDESSDDEEEKNAFGNKPTFSTESVLSAEDSIAQQNIFDRLPLSESNKQLFYKWLLSEHRKDVETRAESDGDVEQSDDEGEEEAVHPSQADGHSAP